MVKDDEHSPLIFIKYLGDPKLTTALLETLAELFFNVSYGASNPNIVMAAGLEG